MMELMRLFRRQGWPVTFASAAAPTVHAADLRAEGVDSAAIQVNDSSFDHWLAQLQPDLVLFDRFISEEQFGWRVARSVPHALRVIETIDLHTLRDARHQCCKREQRVICDVDDDALFSELALREIAALFRADLSILVSDAELALLTRRFQLPSALLHCCPFMFDHARLHRDRPGFDARRDFVTIGNFLHAPNWDAVLWLKQTIWPQIRAQLPHAQLHIYGAYVPAKAMQLHDPARGFCIEGRAESLSAVMECARVVLAPLRFGAGIKTKLADAMCYGTPSVTTSVGAEGMCGGLPWGGAVDDSVDGMVAAAVRLHEMRDVWQQAQQRGFAIARQQFDRHANGRALIGRILKIRSQLTAHRRRHFVGMMLRHHHHRSTEFMSRWIEAKHANDGLGDALD